MSNLSLHKHLRSTRYEAVVLATEANFCNIKRHNIPNEYFRS